MFGLNHVFNLSSEKHTLRRLHKDEIATDVPLVASRYFLSDNSGLLLHHRTWNPPSNPVAAVYMLHGYGEYCDQLDHVAQKLASLGFIVHAFDYPGHGQSEGDRGYIRRLADLSKDALQLVTKVSPHSDLPCFLLGHSTGSLVSLITAEESPEGLWAGVILSAPGLVLDSQLDNPTTRFIITTLSHWFPKFQLTPPPDPSKMSNDSAVILQYSRDPLIYHGGVPVRLVHEFLETIPKAISNAKHLKMPFLLLHGEKDSICNPESSKLLMKELTEVKDKTLKLYPNLLHEVFNEASCMSIVNEVGEWITERVNSQK